MYQADDAGIAKIVTAVNSKGKFFEVKTPRIDKYWQSKIDSLKSKRDHCIGVKKDQRKAEDGSGYTKFIKIWRKRNLINLEAVLKFKSFLLLDNRRR